ncbi:hypothetical protein [Spirosoma rhododendri]|uniref:Uncharacterized protein n=1 Tax=Spirosoma rhododendri TaxID=2728024 RepID=A0A7L5DMX3_9BACT|nr:hypothetical protein [Spirosoma rhododendri]QJD79799.1 hypothetical protein HH216_16280 [Spirosoma rhododendri]
MQFLVEFFNSLDSRHWVLLITSIVSSVIALGLYFAKRRHDIKDKLFEKRHTSYKTFITKLDDMAKAARLDPTSLLKVVGEKMADVLTAEDEAASMKALADMNSAIYAQLDKALTPLLVAKSEINALMLDCSDQMLTYVTEYRVLAQNTIDEVQSCLDVLKPENAAYMQAQFEKMNNQNRAKAYDALTQKMILQMRKELQATYRQ